MPSPAFQIIRDDQSFPQSLRGGVAAIGNFDGVHRGHRAVLAEVTALARQTDRPALAITFEPHPRTFFRPQEPVFRLTPSPVKARLLAAAGLDAVVELGFGPALAAMSPEAFAGDLLAGRLGLSHVVVGRDFRFGKARAGTPELLARLGAGLGFAVDRVAPVGEAGVVHSSREIRARLVDGEVEAAAAILGYRWFVCGRVERGAGRGRGLGFPTANVAVERPFDLRHAVYAVRVRVDGITRDGVASFGRRPQFDNGAPLLEVHVLDYDGDLYGRAAEVEFVAFLRAEARFGSVDELVAQMHRDVAAARARLGSIPGDEPIGGFASVPEEAR